MDEKREENNLESDKKEIAESNNSENKIESNEEKFSMKDTPRADTQKGHNQRSREPSVEGENLQVGSEKSSTKGKIFTKDKKNELIGKARENPWMIASIVLGVLLLGFLFSGSGVTGGVITGGATDGGDMISAKVAGEKMIDFANANGADAELVEVNDEGIFYEVLISIEGQELPLYVTKDGKSFTQSLIPLIIKDKTESAPSNDISKSDRPKVELFIMAMCPYGTQAEKGILSALDLLGDKIDFDLRFVSYAMHGKDEVDQNTRLYCVQKEEPAKLYDYMGCYLREQGADKWDTCLEEVGVSKVKIDDCMKSANKKFKITELFNDKSSWNGGQYPQYNVDKDLNDQYGVQGSPTLVVNGKQAQSGRDSESYLNTICSAFNDVPEECLQELSSDSPSPGFGYSASSGTGNSAQCS